MANIFLAWQNRADEALLSGGSWLSALPLANLQNRQVQKVTRSSGVTAAATQFTADLQSPRPVGVVALVVHNMGVDSKVRVRGASDAGFASVVYDSGFVSVWPTGVIPQDLLEWEEDNFWLATLTPEQRAGFQSPYIHRLPNVTTARYWRVEVQDTSNPAGYVQIGRLFMARGWEPTTNFSYGAGLGYQDPTLVDTSLSGAEFFDVRAKNRVFTFELEYISETEAYGYVLELQRLAGISGEVLVMPDGGANEGQKPLRSFVGRLRQIGQVNMTKPGIYNVRFEVKELL